MRVDRRPLQSMAVRLHVRSSVPVGLAPHPFAAKLSALLECMTSIMYAAHGPNAISTCTMAHEYCVATMMSMMTNSPLTHWGKGIWDILWGLCSRQHICLSLRMRATKLGLKLRKASRTPLIGPRDTIHPLASSSRWSPCSLIFVLLFVPQLEIGIFKRKLALRYPEMKNLHMVPRPEGRKQAPTNASLGIS